MYKYFLPWIITKINEDYLFVCFASGCSLLYIIVIKWKVEKLIETCAYYTFTIYRGSYPFAFEQFTTIQSYKCITPPIFCSENCKLKLQLQNNNAKYHHKCKSKYNTTSNNNAKYHHKCKSKYNTTK